MPGVSTTVKCSVLLSCCYITNYHTKDISQNKEINLKNNMQRQRDRERERESQWGRGRQRGRQRIPTGLCTDSREPDAGLELMNYEIMTWAEVGCFTDWDNQAPLYPYSIGWKEVTGASKLKNRGLYKYEYWKVGIIWGQLMACAQYLDSSRFYLSDVGRMEPPPLARGPHSRSQVLGPSLSSVPSPHTLSSIPHLKRLHVHVCG